MIGHSPFRVVLDANVLYPATLRDTLLRSAAAGLFQAHWSATILDEASRNLIADGRMTPAQAAHLLAAMRAAFPEAMVRGHEPLIAVMPNDPKDRHVAAAAVHIGAQVVVTNNLRDFAVLPDGLEALDADSFLLDLHDLSPSTMAAVIRSQAAALRRPPITREQLLAGLRTAVPRFVEALVQSGGDRA